MRLENGEDWRTVLEWIDLQLFTLEIPEGQKRLVIRCSVLDGRGKPCRKIMGEVHQTEFGGVVMVKYRKREATISAAQLERDFAFERRTRRNTPAEHDTDDEIRASMKQTFIHTQRYFIWNIWGHQPEHPPTSVGTYRHVVCSDHGIFPLDRLPLESAYVGACARRSVDEVRCSLALQPPH